MGTRLQPPRRRGVGKGMGKRDHRDLGREAPGSAGVGYQAEEESSEPGEEKFGQGRDPPLPEDELCVCAEGRGGANCVRLRVVHVVGVNVKKYGEGS